MAIHVSYGFLIINNSTGLLFKPVGWTYRVWIKQQNWRTHTHTSIFENFFEATLHREVDVGFSGGVICEHSHHAHLRWPKPWLSPPKTRKNPSKKEKILEKCLNIFQKWSKNIPEPNPKRIQTRTSLDLVTNKILSYYMRISPWRLSLFQCFRHANLRSADRNPVESLRSSLRLENQLPYSKLKNAELENHVWFSEIEIHL